MADFIISTDSTCDLPEGFCEEHDIDVHPLYYRFGDDTYGDEQILTVSQFYGRMRQGEMPTTSATNPERSSEFFRNRILKGQKNILHIAFSSGLSSSYQNSSLAASEVMEEFPEANIIVVDSISASVGQGLVVYKAVEYMNMGHTLEETAEYTKDIAKHVVHCFTVDDLFHLYRGGRINKATAVVGTIAGVKPGLSIDGEGKLITTAKVRGRKKSLISLVEQMDKMVGSYRDKNDIVFIGCDDNKEDAMFVAELVKERFGISNIVIHSVCPTIGAHTGPGVAALVFLADARCE